MIYCFNTESAAITEVIGIEDWSSDVPMFELVEITNDIEEYESGAFYKREMP